MANRVSQAQLERLLDEIEKNPKMALSSANVGPNSQQTLGNFWNSIAETLNAIGEGCSRNGEHWKRVSSHFQQLNEMEPEELPDTQALPQTQQFSPSRITPGKEKQMGVLRVDFETPYPIMLGATVIGRDPAKCDIVIDDESVSKMHAIIRIKSPNQFFVVDMKSKNGTRKKSKPITPHLATPIQFGDILEFGSVHAMLEPAGDVPMASSPELPMTQVMETPTIHRSAIGTQLRQVTVPESPDVSDKDDSFVMPCKPVSAKSVTPKNRLITTGSQNTNNSLFWKAPSRSPSLKFDLDDSSDSLNGSDVAIPKMHKEVMEVPINEMETQLPEGTNIEVASIHTLGTQLPEDMGIHVMETQMPEQASIHSLETQIPKLCEPHISENTPQTLLNGDNTGFEIKEVSIYDAQTQIINAEHDIDPICGDDKTNRGTKCISESDEEIIFDEFDAEGFEIPNSQPLLNEAPSPNTSTTIKTAIPMDPCIIKSDDKIEASISSCKDLSDQVKNSLNNDDEDLTDSEEHLAKESEKKENLTNLMVSSMNLTETCSNFNVLGLTPISINDKRMHSETSSCQQIPESSKRSKVKPIGTKKLPHCKATKSNVVIHTIAESEEDISDALTQVIETNELSDEPTQIITDDIEDVLDKPKNDFKGKGHAINENKQSSSTSMDDADAPTQIIIDQNSISSPFKMPYGKLSESETFTKKSHISKPHLFLTSSKADQKAATLMTSRNYYDCTQDVMDDLSTQRQAVKETILSPFKMPTTYAKRYESQKGNVLINNKEQSKSPANNYYQNTQELENDLLTQNVDIVPSSQEDDLVGERFPHITKPLKLKQSTDSHTVLENARLSTQQVRDIIGISEEVTSKTDLTSDADDTPKKGIGFYEDLPLSEDIVERKVCGSALIDSVSTMSEDEKSADEHSESDSPIVFRKRKTTKKSVKMNLVSRLNLDNLPTRMSSRTRKPSEKIKAVPKLSLMISNENLDIVRDNLEKIKVHKSKHNSIDQTAIEKTEGRRSKNNNISNEFNLKPTKDIISTEDKKTPNKLSSNTQNQDSNFKKKPNFLKSEPESLETNTTVSTNTQTKLRSKRIGKKSQEANKKSVEKTVMESEKVLSADSYVNQPSEKTHRHHGKIKKNFENKKDTIINTPPTIIKPSKNSTDSDEPISAVRIRISKVSEEHLVGIRRSSRRKNSGASKSANNTPDNKIKETTATKRSNITKKSEDKSRVYSINEHSTDSSSTEGRLDAPNSKRTSRRKRISKEEIITTPSKRLRFSVKDSTVLGPHRVLFTAYNDERMKEMLVKLDFSLNLEGLMMTKNIVAGSTVTSFGFALLTETRGAVVVDDVKDCTVVVTKEIKRTFKFLCAVGLGRPIVGDEWVKACETKKGFADPWSHILADKASEKKFKFNLRRTLQGARNFLAGYHVSCTPSIVPQPVEMKLIVECSGGVFREGGPRWVAMSDRRDQALWAGLRRRGATVVTREFVLTGVLKQQLDLEAYALR